MNTQLGCDTHTHKHYMSQNGTYCHHEKHRRFHGDDLGLATSNEHSKIEYTYHSRRMANLSRYPFPPANDLPNRQIFKIQFTEFFGAYPVVWEGNCQHSH